MRTIPSIIAVTALLLCTGSAMAQTSGGGTGGGGGAGSGGGGASSAGTSRGGAASAHSYGTSGNSGLTATGTSSASSGIASPLAPTAPPEIGRTLQQPGTTGQQGSAPQLPASGTPGRAAPALPHGSQSSTPGAGLPGQGTLNLPGINSSSGAGGYAPGVGSNRRTRNAGTGMVPDRSTSGGGGNTLADCMSFWDKDTHMTKAQWRATCIRSKNALDQTPLEGGRAAATRNSQRAERQ